MYIFWFLIIYIFSYLKLRYKVKRTLAGISSWWFYKPYRLLFGNKMFMGPIIYIIIDYMVIHVIFGHSLGRISSYALKTKMRAYVFCNISGSSWNFLVFSTDLTRRLDSTDIQGLYFSEKRRKPRQNSSFILKKGAMTS